MRGSGESGIGVGIGIGRALGLVRKVLGAGRFGLLSSKGALSRTLNLGRLSDTLILGLEECLGSKLKDSSNGCLNLLEKLSIPFRRYQSSLSIFLSLGSFISPFFESIH